MQLSDLPGLGPARLSALADAGIHTPLDLLLFFPRKYVDFSVITPLAELADGQFACVKVRVAAASSEVRRNGRMLTRVQVSDASGRAGCLWFNQPYVKHKLHTNHWITLYGRVSRRPDFPAPSAQSFTPTQDAPQLVAPQFVEDEQGLCGVYAPLDGVSPKLLRKLAAHLLPILPITELFSEGFRQRFDLIPRAEAIGILHHPPSWDALKKAQHRMAFEELLLFRTAMGALKTKRAGGIAPLLSVSPGFVEGFWQALPFSPTGAQRRAGEEILADLAQSAPMARLLQGDVGSGKTAVAALALAACVQNGYQSALMAPTEILAQQHTATLRRWLPHLNIVLLHGSMRAAERRRALAEIASGHAQIAVGTHALFQAGVDYHNLGLTVTDEQHRFGVLERQSLAKKGRAPHVLIMTATPIPRTLAFILYGDLEISILDEIPPGRTPIRTHVVLPHKRAGLWDFLRTQVQAGRQAYVVCPLIEENPTLDALSAEESLTVLRQALPDLDLGLLHGRLSSTEKNQVMSAFSQGEIQVLVCTTVVEVGVDVPNATVMAVEDADRFGLAQLHQLRGRVGRGVHESYCFLCTGKAAGSERLKLMASTSDGFVIAEADLAMRGPGDYLGTRQSGLAQGNITGLAQNAQLLEKVSRAYAHLQQPAQAQELALLADAAAGYYQKGI